MKNGTPTLRTTSHHVHFRSEKSDKKVTRCELCAQTEPQYLGSFKTDGESRSDSYGKLPSLLGDHKRGPEGLPTMVVRDRLSVVTAVSLVALGSALTLSLTYLIDSLKKRSRSSPSQSGTVDCLPVPLVPTTSTVVVVCQEATASLDARDDVQKNLSPTTRRGKVSEQQIEAAPTIDM